MKFFRKIHLWLSVPFGIIITLICFSGAMLIFEPEITRAVKSDVYYVAEVKDSALPMGALMEPVKAVLPDSVSITGVTVFPDNNRTYQVNLSKPRRASLFVDQYSGRITGKYERIAFFSTMFKLHRWLLDGANPHGESMKIGKLLVGISTLMFVIALISGVVIWWPRARKNLRRSLTISFSNGWKGFWKGLHVAGGIYVFIFVLAMALTGLTWSFDWYRTAFYAVCGVEHTPRNFGQMNTETRTDNVNDRGRQGNNRGEGNQGREHHGRRHGGDESVRHGRGEGRRHSEFSRWQQIYDELKARNPEASQITIAQGSATVMLGNIGNGRASDRYEFDNRSGEITQVSMYADAVGADRLRGWIYSIHTGCFGGLFTRILWLFGALLGASLPLTGYYIWIKRLANKKATHQEH